MENTIRQQARGSFDSQTSDPTQVSRTECRDANLNQLLRQEFGFLLCPLLSDSSRKGEGRICCKTEGKMRVKDGGNKNRLMCCSREARSEPDRELIKLGLLSVAIVVIVIVT